MPNGTTPILSIEDVLSIDDAARELNRSRRQVERLVADGRLPRFGTDVDRKRVFLARADVERMKRFVRVDRRRVDPDVAAA